MANRTGPGEVCGELNFYTLVLSFPLTIIQVYFYNSSVTLDTLFWIEKIVRSGTAINENEIACGEFY